MADNARVRRLSSTDELHDKIDDYQFRGFEVVERSDTKARLQKTTYGSGSMHLLWFLLTFWFTVGLGNLAYAVYAYNANSKEVLLKVE